jgi:hypothetical protein
MNNLLSIYWLLIASVWYGLNGILHDVFVWIKHKGSYDRELLRLLMDGHVLLLSSVLCFIAYLMLQQKIVYGALVSLIVAVFMIVYCLMIFPFLKSFGTLLISVILLLVSIRSVIGY